MGYFLRRGFSRESAGFFFSSFAREKDSSLHAIERARASRQTQQRIAREQTGARTIAATTSLVFVVKRQRHGFSIATSIASIVSSMRSARDGGVRAERKAALAFVVFDPAALSTSSSGADAVTGAVAIRPA
jgi:hypothetical protein